MGSLVVVVADQGLLIVAGVLEADLHAGYRLVVEDHTKDQFALWVVTRR